MDETELKACVLDSKDKMPLCKPFQHSHKAVEVHKKLRWHVGEVVHQVVRQCPDID
jgi:hypothetical protein